VETTISKHAETRTKSRLGISKKIANKNAQRAWESGLTHSEAKGSLRRYLDYLYLSHGVASNVRVYHHHVYIFTGTNLTTVFQLPQKLEKLADKLQRQKKSELG